MLLKRFEVIDYRSINRAKLDDIGRVTTLVGANNEGKSNILRSIKVALTALEDTQYHQMRRRAGVVRVSAGRRNDDYEYNWYNDFPIAKQGGSGITKVRLDFELNALEIEEFKENFDIKINGRIPISLEFGKGALAIDITKQGPAKAQFKAKEINIARFLSQKISFVYIPAIRTADTAYQMIHRQISRRIQEAEKPILASVETRLKIARDRAVKDIETQLLGTLSTFLPSVTSVTIRQGRPDVVRDRGDYDVFIDDGNSTSIFNKGDGVQSLTILALMRSAGSPNSQKSTIYAIEEPEAHLHSDAIHKIRQVIENSDDNTQIFVTTHSPIFVQRRNIRANVIVQTSTASPAESIEQIRNALGVRLPENLVSASAVVLCEGRIDCDFLRRYFNQTKLSEKIGLGELIFFDIDGAGNLEYHAHHFVQMSCEIFAYLHNDQAGEDAIATAVRSGVLDMKRVRLCAHSMRSSAEIEDVYNQNAVNEILEEKGLKPDNEFKQGRAPFSVRLKKLARQLGVPIGKDQILEIKVTLSELDYRRIEPNDETAHSNLKGLQQSIVAFFS